MLLLVAPGSVGLTVRLVDLDFGVLVRVPRGAEARSNFIHTLPKGMHYTPTGSLIPELQRKTTTHHCCHLVLVVGLFLTTSLT